MKSSEEKKVNILEDIVDLKYGIWLQEELERKNRPVIEMAETIKERIEYMLGEDGFTECSLIDLETGKFTICGHQFTLYQDSHGEEHIFGVQKCVKCGVAIKDHPIDNIQEFKNFLVADNTGKCKKCSSKFSLLGWWSV